MIDVIHGCLGPAGPRGGLYDLIMFLVLGLLSGGNVGTLVVLLGREWVFVCWSQRMRYISLVLYTLVMLIAAVARGAGSQEFIPRYYFALFATVWTGISLVLSLIDTTTRSKEQQERMRELLGHQYREFAEWRKARGVG